MEDGDVGRPSTVSEDGKSSGPPLTQTSAGPSMHTEPAASATPVVTIPSTPLAVTVAPGHLAPLGSTSVMIIHAVRMLRSV